MSSILDNVAVVSPIKMFVGISLVTGGLDVITPSGNMGSTEYPILGICVDIQDIHLNPVRTKTWWFKKTQAELDTCSGWAIVNHGKSGVFDKCLNADKTIQESIPDIIKLLSYNGAKRWNNFKHSGAVMVVNNGPFIRAFLAAQMPDLNAHFHFRHIDVMPFSVMADVLAPNYPKPHKDYAGDIEGTMKSTMAELRFYAIPFILGLNSVNAEASSSVIHNGTVKSAEWEEFVTGVETALAGVTVTGF